MSCYKQTVSNSPRSIRYICLSRTRVKERINSNKFTIFTTFLGWLKFKQFADDKNDKVPLTEDLKFVLKWVENIVEKGENAGCQHFLFFPQCFQKVFFLSS